MLQASVLRTPSRAVRTHQAHSRLPMATPVNAPAPNAAAAPWRAVVAEGPITKDSERTVPTSPQTRAPVCMAFTRASSTRSVGRRQATAKTQAAISAQKARWEIQRSPASSMETKRRERGPPQ